MIDKDQIAEFFLFNALDDEHLENIAGFCTSTSLKPGDHLFMEGESAEAFYFIKSGQVKIYKLSVQGNEQILEILEDGSTVAEAAIFDREIYPAYCMALENTLLIKIPAKNFIALIEKEPAVALKIMHAYSKRLRYFVSMIEKLSLQDVRARLARYLLENAEKSEKGLVCRLKISKKELAAVLGTIPETLSRALRILRDKNIIVLEKNNITINSRSALERLLS
ncbi:Crp/Fnr family transcriptional regulator [candidate division KSB1 bacterium]